MNIGITCYPTYGGSGVVATELGIELAARGHQVHFISYSQPFRLTDPQDRIFFHEVSVSQYPLFEYPPYDLALATKMAEVAENYQLDILHVHYAIPHSVSALLARSMLARFSTRRLPFVTTLHGTDITLIGLDRSYLPITRFSIEESDGVTAISSYLRDRTIEEFAIANPIKVIPNFVNCDIYTRNHDAAERAKYAAPEERIIVHLSNFRPVKRVTDVIQIFDRIQQKMPARLLMIGDGPDRSKAEYMARCKKIAGKVDFLGKQDHIVEQLGISDLMLMPSELESFGLASLEGMACEVPSIATAVGGVPEVIKDGETGCLAKVGDIDTMSRYAVDLLSDEAKLRAMGEAARLDARARFCASQIIPLYEDFYESVLDRIA